MRPKGKLLALLAIFAAIGLVTATGAFTTVSAARTVSVNVAGDSGALLQLTGNTTAGNGDYVTTDGNGALTIDLTASNLPNGAQGVNPNAKTTFDSMFDVTNQGTQNVTVNIAKSGAQGDSFLVYKGNSEGTSINGTTLAPGESVPVGIVVDTSDGHGAVIGQGDGFDVSITVEASA